MPLDPEAVISGVLFDIGGVLIRTPFEMLALQSARYGISVEWRGPFDVESDPLFGRVASGEITERQYWEIRAGELATDLEEQDPTAVIRILFDAPEDTVLRPEVIKLAKDLVDAGMTVGLLTNDLTKFHGSDWPGHLPTLATFETLVDLSHTATLKPHPDAYRYAVQALALPPAQILFVDDQPVNVTGALSAGLQAVHFDVVNPAVSVEEIRRLTMPAERARP